MPRIYKYGKYKKQMKKLGAKTVATRKEFSLVRTRMSTAALKKRIAADAKAKTRTKAINRLVEQSVELKKRGKY